MLIYLSLINVTGFFLMWADKKRAKKGAWRISEKTLFGCALLGGSLGTTVGMHVFHHKTKHWYFKYGMPLIFVIQVLFMSYITN
ncbi:MAG: DUF1294 domain-containing protein [Roseburia sp.]|nr:DUF1294 domain-containing protein [Roseburia sp.]